ncbi:hypothetical protein [Clostridium botulinum]|uniref:Uncharacterized protein n=2 Tax=Clostridium botulinum TaxID=1491 RepID=A0A077K7Q3_CLOBO|nr:hypothetical protein [Clostridium botulinum]BAP25620.1 hypothetical protein [Clostridium botulinum]
MRYKIWDKLNGSYLDLTKYCVNGYGDVMTIGGQVFMNQQDFEVKVEDE